MLRVPILRLNVLSSRFFAAWMLLAMVVAVLPALPADDASAQGTGQYSGTKLLCPPGYDLQNSSAQDAFDDCTLPLEESHSFTIRSGDSSYQGSTQSGGQFGWTDVPLGFDYFVTESLPQGYLDPWVYCEVSQFAAGGGDVQNYYFQAPGGEMFIAGDINDYELSNCFWFNVQSGGQQELQPGGTTVSIEKRICDEGYDPATNSLDELYLNCGNLQEGVSFILNDDISTEQQTDNQGRTTFSGVAHGPVRIHELKSQEYEPRRVYCQAHSSSDANVVYAQQDELPLTEQEGAWYVDASVTEDNKIDCIWFNIPVHEGATVYIEKYLCAPEFDYENADLSQFGGDCATPHEGVHFEIPVNAGGHEGTTDSNGELQLPGIPYGNIELHESQDPSYFPARAYCYATAVPNGQLADDKEVPIIDDTASSGDYIIQFEIPDGEDLYCYIFNVPNDEDGFGVIEVTKYICHEDYDYSTSDLESLLDNCTQPHEGAGINLLKPGEGLYGGGTDASGVMRWEDFPSGPVTLRELTEGYAMVRVYCHGVPADQQNTLISEYEESSIYRDSEFYHADTHLEPGYSLHCYLFNFPAEDEYGTVYAYKYNCPPDFDYEGGGRDYLFENCTETPDIHFTLDVESPEFHEEWLVSPEGRSVFEQVPAGPFLLREEAQEGYRLVAVYCGVAEQNNATLPESWSEANYEDGLEYEATANQYVHCEFYNAPSEDYGTVYVYKYACHEDFEYEGASQEDYEANCTQPVEGIPFGVGSSEAQTEQSTDSSGIATFEQVAAGEIGILEGPAEGYLVVKVYCGVIGQNDASLPESWEEVEYQDGLTYDLPAGEYVHCVFYNVPDGDYGSIEITKYLCGPIAIAVDGGGPTYEIFSSQCTDLGVGYSFSLETSSGNEPKATDNNGRIVWTGLDPGEVTVSESLPPGYDSWAVYCSTDPSGPYEEFAGEQVYSFDYTVVAGVTLYCKWFNAAPPTDTYVEVVKYLCPEGYDYEAADYAGISGSCTETIGQVPFNVFNENGYTSPKTTNDEGVATWNTVPESLVSIQETPGEGYLPVKVYCSNTPDDETTPPLFQGYDLDAETYHIEIGVTAGYRLVCHWFNAPVESGQVLVTKYTCDQFFTRGEASYEDYVENCTTPGEGFHFSLVNSNDEVVDEGTTGANGTVPLVSSPPGTHSIVETETEGYITLAVYCTTDQSNPPVSPAGNPPLIDTSPDFTVYCLWFNAPYEPSTYDPGDIVIHKFNCPPGYPTEPQGGRSPDSWFFNGCQQPAPGVTFNVEQGGANVGSGETDDEGIAIITGVSAGTTRISELPREGFGPPKIFCASYPVTAGRVLVSFDEQTIDNWGHSYDLVQDEVLECFWFNFPNSQGTDGQPIQIIVHKYLCEEGYEYSGQSYETISGECTAAEEGVNFDVSGGDGATSGGPTDSGGYAEYNGVVPGSISITETPREGYQTLAIYCTAYVSSAGTPSLFPSEEGQLIYYLADGYTLECYWFNAPVEEHAWVDIIKYVCPTEYDYEAKSHEEVRDNCFYVAEGVDFTLQDGAYSELRSTDSDGRAGWEDVPIETLTLSESSDVLAPARIFCTSIEGEGSEPPQLPWDDYSGVNEIQLDPEAGYRIYCEWFNYSDVGMLKIYKYYCETEYEATSRDDYYAACANPQESVHFEVAGQWGSGAEGETDAAGLFTWEDAPHGPVTMTETPPEGYVPWRVFCSVVQSESDTPSQWDPVELDQQYNASYPITANYYVTCEWYNVPYEEDPPQVWIQKYNCPEETDWQWSYHQFLSGCHEPGPNVEYGIGPDENTLSLSVTDALGRIILGDLNPGTLVIQESLPSGYGGVVVFCQFVYPGYTGPYQKAEVYDQTIQLDLDYNYVVTCVWFNLLSGHEPPETDPPSGGTQPLQPVSGGGTGAGGTPSAGGGTGGGGTPSTGGAGNGTTGQSVTQVDPDAPATLIITKFTCPGGYDVHAPESDPALDCDTLTDEIPFLLANEEDVNEEGQTGDDGEGTVAYADLAAGPYLLTEEAPEGTIAAFIYTCQSDLREFQEENPFTPFAYAGPDGRIGVNLIPGETLECDWYNVPEDVLGGQVTIFKYACPGTSVIVAQCVIFPDGATIGLFPIGDSGEIVELRTGQDGTATAAVEGTYTVQELPTTACLIDSDAFDQAGNLVVNEGEEVEVRVYNCGLET